MKRSVPFNEKYRYGSAAWATEREIERCGFLAPRGPLVGFSGHRPIRIDGDAPMLTIAGAGAGKLRDVLAYSVCGSRVPGGGWYAPPRMFINDLRGELAAISHHNLIRFGKKGFFINPYGLFGLPQHRVNPWDMLV
jgi:type IV secretion system protein VirD4